MKKFLKIVFCLDIISFFGVNAMEPDWSNIVEKTKTGTFVQEEEEYREEANKVFSWEKRSIDWGKVEQSANEGNPTAQYAFAGHLFELSGGLFNGERIKMRTRAYMYAIISAIVGKFGLARNEYIGTDCSLGITSEIPDFLKTAEQMAVKEDF